MMKNVKGLIWAIGMAVMELPLIPLQSADTTPPFIASVGSLNGDGVGVCFSEPVDPVASTNPCNYTVFNYFMNYPGPTLTVTNVTLRPDGQSVKLALSTLLNERFVRVWATNIQDLAGNVITNEYYPGPVGYQEGDLVHLLPVDLPQPGVNPVEPGSVYTCFTIAGRYEVVAGGTGLEGTNDGFHFLFQQRTGDFDILVKVARLDPANRLSKAGLMFRESLLPGSRNLNVMVTPEDVPTYDGSGNGANSYIATWRQVTDGPMAEWPGGSRRGGLNYPNVWVRLIRLGQTFLAATSTDGTGWSLLASTTNPYPNTVYLGLATTSANNCPGFATVADYRAFGDASVTTPAPPRLNVGSTGSAVMVSWLNAPGFRLECTLDLVSPTDWNPVTNLIEQMNGSNQISFDTTAEPQKFFRLKRP